MASSTVCNCTRNIIQLATIFFMLLLLRSASAQYDNVTDFQVSTCGGDAIRNGSALERNLKTVLSSLVENVNKTGYNISSYGENGDKIYGLAQCRGDLNASTCRACASEATKTVLADCNGSRFGWTTLVGCFMRYDTHNFSSSLDLSGDAISGWCNNNKINGTGANARSLDSQIDNVLTKLMSDAVSSNVGYSTFYENEIYSLAQCWRDLSTSQCSQCLNIVYTNMSLCPSGTIEGEANTANCMLRFGRDKFYGDGVPLLSPPTGSGPSIPPSSGPRVSPTGPSRTTEGKGHPKLLGWSIGGAVLMVVLVAVVVIWKRKIIKPGYKKQFPGYYKPSGELSTAISKSKLNYKFQTLQIATKNFNPMNKIGQGGFGSIYKGVIPDGKEIAIKRLFANREESVSDFFNEVNLISRVQHKNLVKLLGCSVDGPDKLLVYEYLPNKSLDQFLFDESMGKILDWKRRFEIILGIASGLAYLHQESDIRIIHRDIKASNILLDHHFKPKIADFGLVRYFDEDQTHLSTGIVGTRGYMAPEYLVHGHLTEKADVYAFGVLVLEIIGGRRNKTPMHANDIPSLLTMVWNCHLSGTISNIIDPNIKENYQDVLQVVHIALLCTQASSTLRPAMSEVIMFLTNKDSNLLEASQPPFIDAIHLQSNINTNIASSHSKSNISVALNHSHSNTSTTSKSNISVALSHSHSNTSTTISPTLETHIPVSNIVSSSTTSMPSNTMPTSSFGPG